MDKIKKILESNGPLLSSDVKELLKKEGLNDDAARQQISRNKDVIKIKSICFPQRKTFLCLTDQYKTYYFYDALINAFKKTNSIHYFIIKTINCLGGVISYNKFKVISAGINDNSKHARRKKLSVILKELLSVGIIRKEKHERYGELIHLSDDIILSTETNYRVNIALSELLTNIIMNWLKDNSFCSYNTISEFGDFCNFTWDITAPTYLLPFISKTTTAMKNGFVIVDIIPQFDIGIDEVEYFIRKCESSYQRRNTRPFLPIIIGLSFSSDAFSHCKKKNLLITTIKNIFGETVQSLFYELKNILENASAIIVNNDSERVIKVFEKILKNEGRFFNIKGDLFEMLAGHIIYNCGSSYIQLGHKISVECDDKIEKAEIDILNKIGQSEVIFYECKGKNASSLVNESEIEYWFSQINIIYRWFIKKLENSNKNVIFEFWTTSDFHPKALMKLKNKSEITNKYKIVWKNGKEILSLAKKGNLNSIAEKLKQHFMHDKVNTN